MIWIDYCKKRGYGYFVGKNDSGYILYPVGNKKNVKVFVTRDITTDKLDDIGRRINGILNELKRLYDLGFKCGTFNISIKKV